ncbi:acyltransferase [Citrobacter sp. wls613]|uniref:acyltransferase n=1 Tax=Citrobacter sp. wls613 TaxID=2576436 RepID=UPI002017737F|nr:acyltransferase [Citrobacter sp. wls613]
MIILFLDHLHMLLRHDKISIGNNVVIRPGTMLFASPLDGGGVTHIEIADDVLIGLGVNIYISNHSFSDINKSIYLQGHSDIQPVILERGYWVGANVTILPGVTIGENSVVGANSVVTKKCAYLSYRRWESS